METCVLLPPQLAVVLVFHPDPRNIFEMRATLWTNTPLTAGTLLCPHKGQFKLDRLDIFNSIDKHDKRLDFGCSDEIVEVEGRSVRHCNWVRFLRVSMDPAEVNVVGTNIDGKTSFEICRDLEANTELIALLKNSCNNDVIEMEEAHIDVIGESDGDETPEPSDSASHCYDRTLAISPISRDDDAFSSGGEDVVITDKSSYNNTPRYNISAENDSGALDLSWSPTSRETPNKQGVVSSTNHTPTAEQLTVTSSTAVMTPPVRRRERSWLPCEVCNKKFDRPSLLKRHMRTHTGEKPHVCDVCSKAFSTSSSLNTHRRIHSGEKPHQCNVCGKRFTASSNLYYHRMTHNKDKPHKCTLCSKSFPTPGDLKSHQYVHSGSWPYKCDVCHRGFSKQTNLKNHVLLHKEEINLCCSRCSKQFTSQRSANQSIPPLCQQCRPDPKKYQGDEFPAPSNLPYPHTATQGRHIFSVPPPTCTSSPARDFQSSMPPFKPQALHSYDQMMRTREFMQAYQNLHAHYSAAWNSSSANY